MYLPPRWTGPRSCTTRHRHSQEKDGFGSSPSRHGRDPIPPVAGGDSRETAQEHQATSPRRQRSGTPGASSIVWHASLPRQLLLAPSGRKRTVVFKGPLSSVDSSTGPGRQAVQVPPVRDEDFPPRPGSLTRSPLSIERYQGSGDAGTSLHHPDTTWVGAPGRNRTSTA